MSADGRMTRYTKWRQAGRKHFGGTAMVRSLYEEEFTRALKHFSVVLSDTRDIIRTGIANLVAMPPRGSFVSVSLAALKAN